MPLPLALIPAISSLLTLRSGFVVGGLIATFKDEILSTIGQVLDGEAMSSWVTEKVNAKLSAAGLDLQFRNVFDADLAKDDADKFAARRVNAKAGTNFATLKNQTRDDFLTEVSRVLAARVNEDTGSNLAAMWPVNRLREELATELARQFQPEVDLPSGSLFPRAKLEMLQVKVGKKLGILKPSPVGSYWGSAPTPEIELRRAKGRARQAKYRRTHRAVWVQSAA